MERIEVNVTTGKREVIQLTQAEVDDANARTAAEQAKKDAIAWLTNRVAEFGTVQEQLEYIVENGVDAFVTKQKAIKAKYPKVK